MNFKGFAHELSKLAYGAEVHRKLVDTAIPRGASEGMREQFAEGAVRSDKGMRDPWLPWTDPIHAFPGSQARQDINKFIERKVDQAAGSISKGLIAQPSLRRESQLAKGMADYGEAQHTLLDRTSHFDKPEEIGLAAGKARKVVGALGKVIPGYGGMIPSAIEHGAGKVISSLKRGKLSRTGSKIDVYKPERSSSDVRVGADVRSLRTQFHRAIQENLESRRVPPETARKLVRGLYKEPLSETGRVVGTAIRDTGYIAEESMRAAKAFGPLLKSSAADKMKIITVGPELGSGHISQAKNLAEAARKRGIDAEIVDYNKQFFSDKRKTVKETGKLYEQISRYQHEKIPEFILKGIRQAQLGADPKKVKEYGEKNRDAAIVSTWSAARYGLKPLDSPLYVYHVDQSLNPYDDPKLQLVSDAVSGRAKDDVHVGETATVAPYKGKRRVIPVKGVAVSRRVLDSKGAPELLKKEHFNITVSGGGYGMDVPEAADKILSAKNLPENTRVHAVAGYGEGQLKELHKLKKRHGDKLVPHGYAPLPDMMRSADLNVVRGHGTSIGEAQTSGKPAVYFAGDRWNFQNVLTRNNVVQTGKNYNIPVAPKVQDIPAAVEDALKNYSRYQIKAEKTRKHVGDAADEAVVKIMKDHKRRQK